MTTIHNEVLYYDLKKCIKKKWYPGLEKELPRVLKLLDIDKALPGQLPMRGFSGELAGKIWHARINLPDEGFGKRKGARLAYFLDKNSEKSIAVLYIGGHKDPLYDSRDLSKLISKRYKAAENDFTAYEDFKTLHSQESTM